MLPAGNASTKSIGEKRIWNPRCSARGTQAPKSIGEKKIWNPRCSARGTQAPKSIGEKRSWNPRCSARGTQAPKSIGEKKIWYFRCSAWGNPGQKASENTSFRNIDAPTPRTAPAHKMTHTNSTSPQNAPHEQHQPTKTPHTNSTSPQKRPTPTAPHPQKMPLPKEGHSHICYYPRMTSTLVWGFRAEAGTSLPGTSRPSTRSFLTPLSTWSGF